MISMSTSLFPTLLLLLLILLLPPSLPLVLNRVKPGKLILVRHGQSLWNANKTFTGWCDPDLSPQGAWCVR